MERIRRIERVTGLFDHRRHQTQRGKSRVDWLTDWEPGTKVELGAKTRREKHEFERSGADRFGEAMSEMVGGTINVSKYHSEDHPIREIESSKFGLWVEQLLDKGTHGSKM